MRRMPPSLAAALAVAALFLLVDLAYSVALAPAIRRASEERGALAAAIHGRRELLKGLERIRPVLTASVLPHTVGDSLNAEAEGIGRLNRWIDEAGLSLASIKPVPRESRAGTAYSFDLILYGEFSAFYQLCHSIENSPLLMRVDNFTVESGRGYIKVSMRVSATFIRAGGG